tara:strand:+ start:216 stop:485 length:270 start_codon:yes stop_codon:yes gene_type:complete
LITKHSSWYGINIGHYRSQNYLIESIFDGSKINPSFACAFNAFKAMEIGDLGLEWLYRVFKNQHRIKKAIMCYPRFIYLLITKISYEEK